MRTSNVPLFRNPGQELLRLLNREAAMKKKLWLLYGCLCVAAIDLWCAGCSAPVGVDQSAVCNVSHDLLVPALLV